MIELKCEDCSTPLEFLYRNEVEDWNKEVYICPNCMAENFVANGNQVLSNHAPVIAFVPDHPSIVEFCRRCLEGKQKGRTRGMTPRFREKVEAFCQEHAKLVDNK